MLAPGRTDSTGLPPVPTGREELWRFTPLERTRGLLDAVVPTDATGVRIDFAETPGVSLSELAELDAPGGAARDEALAYLGARPARLLAVTASPGGPVELAVVAPTQPAADVLRVDVAPGVEATVVLRHSGPAQLLQALDVVVGDGGALTLVSVQELDDDAVRLATHRVRLGRDARLRHVAVSLGGGVDRLAVAVEFGAPGGDAELLGVGFATGGQHQEQRLHVVHEAPHCRSNVVYKNALAGRREASAHTVWVGDVVIEAAGVGTDTYELNRNLLLNRFARADSVPNLEIETGNVVGAGHASATGRFDEEQVFYLCSRGIPADLARRLVVRGFFADVLSRVGLPDLEDQVIAALDARLEGVQA